MSLPPLEHPINSVFFGPPRPASPVALVKLRGPSGPLLLPMIRHHERAVGHVAQDSGARSHVNVVADLDRRHELAVASHHASVPDLAQMFVVAIVVDRDNPASDVGIASDNHV